MKCGGCVGHVKQLLEQHAGVSAATVNLATETALVRVKLQPGTDITTLAAELAKVSVCVDTWGPWGFLCRQWGLLEGVEQAGGFAARRGDRTASAQGSLY